MVARIPGLSRLPHLNGGDAAFRLEKVDDRDVDRLRAGDGEFLKAITIMPANLHWGGDDWRTLFFRFSPGAFAGKTFEFDCDTDGGQGVSGGDMEGMVVTITLEGGEVLTGELQLDPSNGQRDQGGPT